MSDRRLLLKAALSVFIAYHLFCVSLLPNSASIIGRKLGAVLTPYANPLIFNRTWQFFSPGPMPRFDLEYEVITPDSEMDLMRDAKIYPVKPDGFTLGDYYLRSLAGMRFLGIKDDTFEKFFIPYLCRQYPTATALDIRSVMEEVPQMESIGSEETMGFKDLAERKDLPRRRYECPGHEVSVKKDIEDELDRAEEDLVDWNGGEKPDGNESAKHMKKGDGSGGQPLKNDPSQTTPGGEEQK